MTTETRKYWVYPGDLKTDQFSPELVAVTGVDGLCGEQFAVGDLIMAKAGELPLFAGLDTSLYMARVVRVDNDGIMIYRVVNATLQSSRSISSVTHAPNPPTQGEIDADTRNRKEGPFVLGKFRLARKGCAPGERDWFWSAKTKSPNYNVIDPTTPVWTLKRREAPEGYGWKNEKRFPLQGEYYFDARTPNCAILADPTPIQREVHILCPDPFPPAKECDPKLRALRSQLSDALELTDAMIKKDGK